jgi:hypothetical protein
MSITSGFLGDLGSMRIVIHDSLIEWEAVPVKKHRRSRIQKKWSKRWGYKKIRIGSSAIHVGDTIIMDSFAYEALVKHFRETTNCKVS